MKIHKEGKVEGVNFVHGSNIWGACPLGVEAEEGDPGCSACFSEKLFIKQQFWGYFSKQPIKTWLLTKFQVLINVSIKGYGLSNFGV